MKMFFYPIYMKTRHWGPTNALVFSTLLVFVFTWLLHSYQWFWLQGDFPLTTVDGVYWMLLGVFVAINSVWETKKGKKKSLSRKGFDWGGTLTLTAKTVATFVFLGLMWSFWSSESVSEWVTVMSAASDSGASAWMWLMVGLAGLFIALVLKEWLEAKGVHIFFDERKMSFQAVASRTSAMALGVVLLGMPQVQSLIGDNGEYIASLQGARLNARDQAQLERGYYENLMSNDSYTSGMLGNQGPQQPADWVGIYETDAVEMRGDERLWELRPDVDIKFKDARLRTNRWGMRDQDYTKEKPANTHRIAILGASYVMGAGVEDHQTFEAVVEDRLNEVGTQTGNRYELLNFSVGGYGLIQQVMVAKEQAFAFKPDALLYIAQPGEVRRTIERFLPALMQGNNISTPHLVEVLEKAGITEGMKRADARKRLFDVGEELAMWGYNEIAEMAHQHNAIPALVLLPNTARLFEREEKEFLNRVANELGFEILNLEGVYDDHKLEQIRLAPWDMHPNKMGHQLIADKLYEALEKNGRLLPTSLDNSVLSDASH